MTGPSAGVLIPGAWTRADAGQFSDWLTQSLSHSESPDWWALREPQQLGLADTVRTGPMLIEPGPFPTEDAEEVAELHRALGFVPGTEVVLAAAANGTDDHHFLGRLALAIARRHHGLIDLGGMLPVPPPTDRESPASRRDWADQARATIATLPGRSHEIPYRTAGDWLAAYHVIDPDLLAAWLQHPLFRMVK